MAFLQYKAGAIPGKPLKRKVTPEEMRERKKQYEKDRERKCVIVVTHRTWCTAAVIFQSVQ
jgi:hypothetical protein